MSASLKDRVLGTPGYDASLRLDDDELSILRTRVNTQYLHTVWAAGIKSHGQHAELFPKSKRLFDEIDIALVKALPFMQTLRAEIGNFTLSKVILPDGTQEDREEIYWRIVRPNCHEDVGKLHRDSDFHKQYGIEQGKQTVKCWIPLWCESGCGLHIFPDPSYEFRVNEGLHIDHSKTFSEPGTLVLFGAQTYHRGEINTGTTARVSVEMTLVLDGS